MKKVKKLKKRLLEQAGRERQNLNLLLAGASLFFTGMGLIYYSEYFISSLLGSTLKQELTALTGLVLIFIGGVVATTGYLCLSVLRIFKIIDNDKD